MKYWGGRFNRIYFLESAGSGYRINQTDFSNLSNFNPDFICTDIVLSNSLKNKLINRLTPLDILEITKNEYGEFFMGYSCNGVQILPNDSDISRLAYSFDSPYFINFKPSKETSSQDNFLQLFINANFGGYDTSYSSFSNLPLLTNYKEYSSSDMGDIVEFIDWYSSTRKSVVFSSQLSSIGAQLANKEPDYLDNDFLIIVGDDIKDMAFFWNRQTYMTDFKSKFLNQLWIPTRIFSDIPNIKKLISKISSTRLGSGQPNIVFLSTSLSDENLRNIVGINQEYPFYVDYKFGKIEDYINPKFISFFSIDMLVPTLKSIDLIKVDSNIMLEKPNIFPNYGNGKYMTDIYIEYHPERFLNVIGRTFWWQFPSNNNVLSIITKRKGRILNNRHASILMDKSENEGNWHDYGNENKNFCSLDIRIPNEDNFFRSTLLSPKEYNKNFPKWLFYDLNISDAGKTLRGSISVFGSLESLYDVFQEEFWRDLFHDLAKGWKMNHSDFSGNIKNRIKKKLPIDDFVCLKNEDYDNFIDSVSTIVCSQVKGIHLNQSNTISLNDIIKKAKGLGLKSYLIERIEDQVSDFIENKILIQGIKPKCLKCSHFNWYNVNELDTKISCRTCGYPILLSPKIQWLFKLNDLVMEVIENTGLVPVILVLGDLLQKATSSFIYSPPLDIYKSKKRKITDLDICCVVDGELIIGEVKEKHSLFSENDFKKLLNVGLKIKPDRIIFASLDSDFTTKKMSQINKWIRQLQESLEKEGIKTKVEWYKMIGHLD